MLGQTMCRACGSDNLYNYLPLGDHPAANAFVREERRYQPDQVYPLNTHVCLDCALIQVPDPLPSDYYVDYVYMPSASATMPEHFRALARRFRASLAQREDARVVDIGSNDGLLLAACKDEGLKVLGVDPSLNISDLARERGVETHNAYFTAESAQEIRRLYGPAQVIVTTNTFNHIDDLHDFMKGVGVLLDEDGVFVVEVPQALTCIQFNEFDTVYHEHLSVFSAASIVALGKTIGLTLVNIEELPVHGGSMRCYLRRGGEVAANVIDYLDRERAAGLFDRATYDAHAARVAAMRDELMGLLARLKREGRTVAGYSAPAKGNTLLNYYGIGPDTLPYIADRNTLKQGRYTPGMRIKVVSPDHIDEDKPDYLLILAWNFKDEIIAQLDTFRARGGKFILPIPAIEIVE